MHSTRVLVRVGRSAVIALIPLALVGCATTSKPGFPKQSVDDAAQIAELEKQFKLGEKVSGYDFENENKPTDETKAARDQIISQKLVLMDLQYNRFVSEFAFEKQTIDTVTDIIVLGLNIAGTAVGAAGTKTVLSAISSGVVGSKLSVDKNFYYEKTVAALVAAMNAQRKAALVPILEGMRLQTDAYPLGRALADLDSYYRAGTFLGALQAIQMDAGAKERDENEKIKNIRTLRPVTKEDVETTAALTSAIGKLTDTDADVAKGKKALELLNKDTSDVKTVSDVRARLTHEVREADPARLKDLTQKFKDAGILTE